MNGVLHYRLTRALVAIGLTALVCCYILLRQDAAAAQRAVEDAETRLDRAMQDARAITRLRERQAVVLERPWPASQLLERLRPHLTECRIPSDALQRHTLREPTKSKDAQFELHGVSVTLGDITPAQLAELLARWRTSEPVWSISDIRLTHAGSSRRDARGEIADRYSAQIEFQALAVSSGGNLQ